MTDHHTSLDEDVARGLHHLSAVLAALVAGSAQACRLVADAPRVLEVLCDCVDITGTLIALLLPSSTSPSPIMGH